MTCDSITGDHVIVFFLLRYKMFKKYLRLSHAEIACVLKIKIYIIKMHSNLTRNAIKSLYNICKVFQTPFRSFPFKIGSN